MASNDVTRCLSVPGQFTVTPSSLTHGAHGGTLLGYLGSVSFQHAIQHELIVAEEFGEEAVDVLETRGTGVLGFTMRQWDPTALSYIFPASTANSNSNDGERIIEEPSTLRSGRLLAASGLVILFSPKDPRNPAFLAYRAVPVLDATARLNFGLNTDLEVAAMFYLLRGSGGKPYTIARLEDMTLP